MTAPPAPSGISPPVAVPWRPTAGGCRGGVAWWCHEGDAEWRALDPNDPPPEICDRPGHVIYHKVSKFR